VTCRRLIDHRPVVNEKEPGADGDRAQLVDRQADQARSDFAAIECELEFVKAQLARLPIRKDLARLTLLAMTRGAALTTILALIVLR
jgi:hypothetical protein